MKYNVFDVVLLKDKNKAIISEVYNNEYKVKISNKNKPIEETRIVNEKDIDAVLYKSNIHKWWKYIVLKRGCYERKNI